MQDKAKNLFRGVMVSAVALGFMGTAALTTPAGAQTTCVDEPGLALFDQGGDGILDVADLQRVANLFPDNARLQELVAQASADPNFSIQYDGNCDGGGETPVPTEPGTTPVPTEPGTTPVPTEPGTTPAPGGNNGGGDDNGTTDPGTTPGGDVSDLPDTGAGQEAANNSGIWLMAAAGSAVAASGAAIFRSKKA